MISIPTSRLVIVDDDPVMLKFLAAMAHSLGWDATHTYTDAAEALRDPCLFDGLPVSVLLDINMPGMDGIEFVRHLAERDFNGCLVLVSGENEAMRRATAMLAQARGLRLSGVLAKPPTREAMNAALCGCAPDFSAAAAAAGIPRFGHSELRAALDGRELLNFYQPQVCPRTGAVVGVESLVRWQHPRFGLLAPTHFVPVAERYGLIGALLDYTLREGLHDLAAWQRSGLDLRLAVNVSMDNLSVTDTADFIEGEARAAGVDPHRLVLEVTESRLMRDLATALDVLARLHLKRFRLSVDDFGTGHSTLVVLRDLLFDELKIDAGFVHRAAEDERLASFFRASLGLARNLGMEAVAEGVEDRMDWAFARSERCHLAQGWFIGHPMPAGDLAEWMSDWDSRCTTEGLLDEASPTPGVEAGDGPALA